MTWIQCNEKKKTHFSLGILLDSLLFVVFLGFCSKEKHLWWWCVVYFKCQTEIIPAIFAYLPYCVHTERLRWYLSKPFWLLSVNFKKRTIINPTAMNSCIEFHETKHAVYVHVVWFLSRVNWATNGLSLSYNSRVLIVVGAFACATERWIIFIMGFIKRIPTLHMKERVGWIMSIMMRRRDLLRRRQHQHAGTFDLMGLSVDASSLIHYHCIDYTIPEFYHISIVALSVAITHFCQFSRGTRLN